jgi:hypothetical protein
MQLGSHPVAVVQYTCTHKQYRELHKTNNTQNNTKIHKTTQKIKKKKKKLGRVRSVPRLCGFYPGICLKKKKKARAVCRPKHVEQLRNTGIINSTTRLHLVDSFYEFYITMHGSMNIKSILVIRRHRHWTLPEPEQSNISQRVPSGIV